MRPACILILLSLMGMVCAASAQEHQTRPHPDGGIPLGERAAMDAKVSGAGDAAVSPGAMVPHDSPEPDRAAGSGIRCNWDGWQFATMTRDCWRCWAYTDTLRTECTDGWVTRIEKVRVCIECWDGK